MKTTKNYKSLIKAVKFSIFITNKRASMIIFFFVDLFYFILRHDLSEVTKLQIVLNIVFCTIMYVLLYNLVLKRENIKSKQQLLKIEKIF